MSEFSEGATPTEATQDSPVTRFTKVIAERQATIDAKLKELGQTGDLGPVVDQTRITRELTADSAGRPHKVVISRTPYIESESGNALIYPYFSYDVSNPDLGKAGLLVVPNKDGIISDPDKRDPVHLDAHLKDRRGDNLPLGVRLASAPDRKWNENRPDIGDRPHTVEVDTRAPYSVAAFQKGWTTAIDNAERTAALEVKKRMGFGGVLDATAKVISPIPPVK